MSGSFVIGRLYQFNPPLLALAFLNGLRGNVREFPKGVFICEHDDLLSFKLGEVIFQARLEKGGSRVSLES